jgi:hypothetical protein
VELREDEATDDCGKAGRKPDEIEQPAVYRR